MGEGGVIGGESWVQKVLARMFICDIAYTPVYLKSNLSGYFCQTWLLFPNVEWYDQDIPSFIRTF